VSAALVYVDAVGFRVRTHAWSGDAGLGGGARLALRLGPLLPFVGVRGVGWLVPQSARVTGPGGGINGLPRFDVFFEAGVAWGDDRAAGRL